jgi:hypothetical protein
MDILMDDPKKHSLTDEFEIRSLIEKWVIYRDGGVWDRFAELWHPQGHMIATWFQASAPDFIARSKKAFSDGMKSNHTLGGTAIDVTGNRAIAQTKMQIMQRAPLNGIEVDVTCWGRFYDFLEKLDGRWVLYLRQPIYELDRLTPVDPNAKDIILDREILNSYPEGYRHLAYLQSKLGFDVSRDLPGTRGPAIEALKQRGGRWLAGEDIVPR